MYRILIAISACSLLSAAPPAKAELTGFGQSEGLSLGAGIIAEFSPYQGVETPDVTPIPYIAWDWENAHIGVDGISYSFFNSDVLEITLLADPRFSFTDPDDSPLFEGIDRKTALEAGARAKLSVGNAYAETQFQHDITDVHNGYEATAKIGWAQDWDRFSIDLGGGVSLHSKELNAHLFGVRSDEARADLAEFAPPRSFNAFAEAELGYALSSKTLIYGFAQYTRLSKKVRLSPLVDKKGSATVGLAILQRF